MSEAVSDARGRRKRETKHRHARDTGALSENEWQWECKERINRKRKIVVRGLRVAGSGNKVTRNIRWMIREKLGVDPKKIKLQRVGGGPVVTLQSMRAKIAVMRR